MWDLVVIIRAGVNFLTGFVLWCVPGQFEIHNEVFSKFFLMFSSLFSIIRVPNPVFLSEFTTFSVAILVFLIPLSIEIVSKISERYQSNVITNLLKVSLWGTFLPIVLLANVVLAIIFRAFINDKIVEQEFNFTWEQTIWKIVSLAMLISFIYIVFKIYFVIKHIYSFMSDEENVINQLYQDAEKTLEE